MSESTEPESTKDVTDVRPEGASVPAGTAASSKADGATPPAPARRRKPVLDRKLAEAREFALSALKELADPEEIGEGHRVVADDERLVTHYFTSNRRGYLDWEWYVTIARAPRQSVPTVCESGLLPAEGALLAPHWVPWSDRLSDDERHADAEDGAETDGAETDGAETDAGTDSEAEAEAGAADGAPADPAGDGGVDGTAGADDQTA